MWIAYQKINQNLKVKWNSAVIIKLKKLCSFVFVNYQIINMKSVMCQIKSRLEICYSLCVCAIFFYFVLLKLNFFLLKIITTITTTITSPTINSTMSLLKVSSKTTVSFVHFGTAANWAAISLTITFNDHATSWSCNLTMNLHKVIVKTKLSSEHLRTALNWAVNSSFKRVVNISHVIISKVPASEEPRANAANVIIGVSFP